MPSVVGNKPNQRYQFLLGVLNDILDGFDNQAIMLSTFKDFIETLHNQDLPYSEMISVMSSLSGRLPPKLEESIRTTVEMAKSKGEGTEFPAVRLKKLLENYIQEAIRPADQGILRAQLSPLLDIVERYLHGLKEHEITVIGDLLSRYEQTESLFNGSIEARVLVLREQNKDNLDKVVSLVLSHAKAQSKGKLVMALLDHVKSSGLILSNPESRMYQVLQGLAALEARCVFLIFLYFT
jgi:acetyl-CoA carboxylase/biotin carboxylase 1